MKHMKKAIIALLVVLAVAGCETRFKRTDEGASANS